MGRFNIGKENLVEAVTNGLIVAVMTFGVTYLRGIGLDTQKLNLNLVKLQYEIRSLSENQNAVNKQIMTKLNSHENRIQFIEKKRIR